MAGAAEPGADPALASETDARHVGINLLGLLVQASGPAYHALIARAVGASGYGVFSWSGGMVEGLSFLVLFGMDLGVRREVSQAIARAEDPSRAIGTALRAVVLAGIALGLGMYWAAPQLAAWQREPALVTPLRILAWGPLLFHAGTVLLCASQAALQMRLAVWARSVVQPIALFSAVGAAARARPGAASTALAIVLANALTLGFVIATHRGVLRLGEVARVALAGSIDRGLLRYGRGLVLGGAFFVVLARLDLFVLGRYADSVSVAILAASLVFASGVTQLKGAFDVPFSAVLSRALLEHDREALRAPVQRFSRWAVMVATPVAIVFGGLSELALGLLGESFVVGRHALEILLLGQLCVACSISGMLVALSGRVLVSGAVAAFAAALELGLLVWLVPLHGFVGAAIASAIGAASCAATLMLLAFRYSGAWPLGRHALQALLAGALATGVARSLVSMPWPLPVRVAMALFGAGVTYVLALLLLGLHPEDRVLARRALRRVGAGRG